MSAAVALRDLLEPLIDVFRQRNPTEAEIEAAVDDITARQDEYWWLNLSILTPVACVAGMAVWTNRVAGIARGLGYPARHSTGWASAGWFVPFVALWFPYQSIVDSLSPTNPRRPAVLSWWLLHVLGVAAAADRRDRDRLHRSVGRPAGDPVRRRRVRAGGLGLRVVALVHDDHERAVTVAR